MSDKFYIGRDLVSFSDNGKYKPVSRVTLKVDDENIVTAGDDTGMELVADCPFATQEMADALLAQFKGHQYQAYEADAANIDPAAELGDGITADGRYSVISRMDDDGRGYPSLSAPGEAEMEDEYPSIGPMTQEFNRKVAKTYALISKTADEIRLLVEQEVGELGDKYTELKVTLDGVTVTDETGTSRIRGSSIETDTLYVNAANIRGTLTADQIVLSGSITWEDLDSTVQNNINSAGGISASEARTIINSTLVSSPNIAGAKFWDLDQDTWLEIDTVGGVSSMKLSTADGVAFSIGLSDTLGHFSMGAAGWPFLNVYESWNEVHPNGSWNFSQAPFIGVVNFSGANYVDMTGTEVDFTGSTITGLTPRFAS